MNHKVPPTFDDRALRDQIGDYGPPHFAQDVHFDRQRFFDETLPQVRQPRKRSNRQIGWTAAALVIALALILGGGWLKLVSGTGVATPWENGVVRQQSFRQTEHYWSTLPAISPGLHWISAPVSGGSIRRVWIPISNSWGSSPDSKVVSWGSRQTIGSASVGYGVSIQNVHTPLRQILQRSMGPTAHWMHLRPMVTHARLLSHVGEAMSGHQVRQLEMIANGTHTILIMGYVPTQEQPLLRTMMEDVRFSFAKAGEVPARRAH